jgi:3-methyladenine DNA glycosylase/8-oxoguanine DNA glycosylase
MMASGPFEVPGPPVTGYLRERPGSEGVVGRGDAPSLRRHPGLRVPGAFDGFETAARVVIGQQVSVAAAGEDRIAKVGMPGACARTLLAIAQASVEGWLQSHSGGDVEATREALLDLPSVGPWTAEVVAMRALDAPDAFPPGDLGVLRALGGRLGAGGRGARRGVASMARLLGV